MLKVEFHLKFSDREIWLIPNTAILEAHFLTLMNSSKGKQSLKPSLYKSYFFLGKQRDFFNLISSLIFAALKIRLTNKIKIYT